MSVSDDAQATRRSEPEQIRLWRAIIAERDLLEENLSRWERIRDGRARVDPEWCTHAIDRARRLLKKIDRAVSVDRIRLTTLRTLAATAGVTVDKDDFDAQLTVLEWLRDRTEPDYKALFAAKVLMMLGADVTLDPPDAPDGTPQRRTPHLQAQLEARRAAAIRAVGNGKLERVAQRMVEIAISERSV